MHLELFRIPLEPSFLDDYSGKIHKPQRKKEKKSQHDFRIPSYPLINGEFNDRFWVLTPSTKGSKTSWWQRLGDFHFPSFVNLPEKS